MADIIPLRRPASRTYTARSLKVFASGFEFQMSGTLDGGVDFVVIHNKGTSGTFNILPGEARLLANALIAAADDVQKNCLYELDALLMPGAPDA